MLRKIVLLRRGLLVIVALVVAFFAMQEYKAYTQQNAPREQVLVAKQDIGPYKVISSSDLGYITLPAGSRQADSIQDPKLIIGKLSRSAIYRGDQIIPQKISDSRLSMNEDERAVGVPLDAVRAVGLTIRPGDHVDVYWLKYQPQAQAAALPGRQQPQTLPAQLVASDATVFDTLDESSASSTGAAPPPPERRASAGGGREAVVVLKVKQSEVQDVVTAVGNGMAYLAKRQVTAQPAD